MISFTSLLWAWRTDAAGTWYFLTVPEEIAGEIKAHALGTPRGFQSVRVEASVGGVSWRTSVFPLKSGGYILPVKADIRRRAGLAVGDEVSAKLQLL